MAKRAATARLRRVRPSSYHHGDLARALTAAARRLVVEDGADAFSLREAALKCGVAVASAYRHFDSKEALLLAVADQGFAELVAAMREALAGVQDGCAPRSPDEARLVALGRCYVRFAVAGPNLFRLMYGPSGARGGSRDPRPDAPSHEVSTLLRITLEAVLQANGRHADDVEARKLLAWSAVHGFAVMLVDGLWVPADDAQLEARIDLLGGMVLASLR